MPAPHQPRFCPACGAANGCALAAGEAPQTCWCWRLETRAPLPGTAAGACYCPTCLTRAVSAAGDGTRHER